MESFSCLPTMMALKSEDEEREQLHQNQMEDAPSNRPAGLNKFQIKEEDCGLAEGTSNAELSFYLEAQSERKSSGSSEMKYFAPEMEDGDEGCYGNRMNEIGKGKKRGKRAFRRETLEDRRREERRAEEEEDEGQGEEEGEESDTGSTSATGKRTSVQTYNFRSDVEQKLVEFYATNDCYYNKGSEHYVNTGYKKRLLENVARELGTDTAKILGWFKNQRTAVGKLYKMKSAHALEQLTTRKKWQLANFKFLKPYIVPRTYTHDADSPQRGEPIDEEVEEEEAKVTSTAPQRSTESTVRGPKRCRTNKIDEALLQFLAKPREPEPVPKKTLDSTQTEERTAFGSWFCSRLHKVPEERWDDFQHDAYSILNQYTRERPAARPPPPPSRQTPSVQGQCAPWPQQQQQQWLQQQLWAQQQQWSPQPTTLKPEPQLLSQPPEPHSH